MARRRQNLGGTVVEKGVLTYAEARAILVDLGVIDDDEE